MVCIYIYIFFFYLQTTYYKKKYKQINFIDSKTKNYILIVRDSISFLFCFITMERHHSIERRVKGKEVEDNKMTKEGDIITFSFYYFLVCRQACQS